MALILAQLLPPMVLVNTRQPLFSSPKKFTLPALGDGQSRLAVIAKATGESSESSTSPSVVKSVQNVWNKSEDRVALFGLGFAAVVGLWASVNIVSAIDRLPVLPTVLELVGILFSSWFIYRYLLFKPDREEFFRAINKSISDVLGQ